MQRRLKRLEEIEKQRKEEQQKQQQQKQDSKNDKPPQDKQDSKDKQDPDKPKDDPKDKDKDKDKQDPQQQPDPKDKDKQDPQKPEPPKPEDKPQQDDATAAAAQGRAAKAALQGGAHAPARQAAAARGAGGQAARADPQGPPRGGEEGLVMKTLLSLGACLALLATASAQNGVQVNARLTSGIVKLGSPAALLLEVAGASTAQPSDPPQVEGLHIGRPGPPSRQSYFSFVNGQRSSSSTITWSFPITADRKGEFKIPPLEVTADGKLCRSNEVWLRVVEDLQGEQLGKLEIHAPSTVIEGQPFTVELGLRLGHAPGRQPREPLAALVRRAGRRGRARPARARGRHAAHRRRDDQQRREVHGRGAGQPAPGAGRRVHAVPHPAPLPGLARRASSSSPPATSSSAR